MDDTVEPSSQDQLQIERLENEFRKRSVSEVALMLRRGLSIINTASGYFHFLNTFSDVRIRQKLVDTGRFALSRDDFQKLGVKPPSVLLFANIELSKIRDNLNKARAEKTAKHIHKIEVEKNEVQEELAASEEQRLPDTLSAFQDQMVKDFSAAISELNSFQIKIESLARYSHFHVLNYGHLLEVYEENKVLLVDLFDRYVEDVGNVSFAKALEIRLRKQRKFEQLIDLWCERLLAKDFAVIQKQQRADLVLPHRIYRTLSIHDEAIQFRFSEDLVKTFFWNSQNSGLHEAALHAMTAIMHGWSPNSSLQGMYIYHLPGLDFEKPMVRLKLVGHNGLGAIRVYGVLEPDRTISFVHWEQEGSHDARYLGRVLTTAFQKSKNEDWP